MVSDSPHQGWRNEEWHHLGHESSGVVPAIGAEGRENGRGKLIILGAAKWDLMNVTASA